VTKDETLTIIAVLLLLFSAMITWNIYSLLIFLAIILILTAWYLKQSRKQEKEASSGP
jgi:membrane protein implicated in regulation of membrane protease activity